MTSRNARRSPRRSVAAEPVNEAVTQFNAEFNRQKRAQLSDKIAEIFSNFTEVYGSDEEKTYVTCDNEPGECIPLKRKPRNSRCFPDTAFVRNAKLFKDFVEFVSDNKRNLRVWCIRPKKGKTSIKDLRGDLREFNEKIDKIFSRLRKRGIFEPLLTTIHIKFMKDKNEFDLHAHVIARVQHNERNDVVIQLNASFSTPHTPNERIRKIEAATSYILKNVMNHEEMVDWPLPALQAALDLSLSRARLVRPGGSFARWLNERSTRKGRSKLSDEERAERRRATDEARAKRERNRADTAYGEVSSLGPRVGLVRNFISPIDGRRRTAWLHVRKVPRSTKPEHEDGASAPAHEGGTVAAQTTKSPSNGTAPRRHHSSPLRAIPAWWRKVWRYGGDGVSEPQPLPIRRRLARRSDRKRVCEPDATAFANLIRFGGSSADFNALRTLLLQERPPLASPLGRARLKDHPDLRNQACQDRPAPTPAAVDPPRAPWRSAPAGFQPLRPAAATRGPRSHSDAHRRG